MLMYILNIVFCCVLAHEERTAFKCVTVKCVHSIRPEPSTGKNVKYNRYNILLKKLRFIYVHILWHMPIISTIKYYIIYLCFDKTVGQSFKYLIFYDHGLWIKFALGVTKKCNVLYKQFNK